MMNTNSELMTARAWCETFGDFTAWLDDTGLQVDRLPSWPSAAPVRVVATPGGRLYMERILWNAYYGTHTRGALSPWTRRS